MTIEQLVNMSADEFEKLTDEELTKLLTPYFSAAKPDPTKVILIKKKETLAQKQKSIQREYEKTLDIARQLGLDV